jgi:hypothetical protein
MLGLSLGVMLCFLFPSLSKAQDVKVFLGDFEIFVDSFVKTDSLTAVQLDSIRTRYSSYTEKYLNTYKAQMDNKQLGDYSQMKARYNKKMASYNTGKVVNKVDSAASRVGKAIKRTGSQVSGYVRGTFKKESKKEK